MRLHWCVKRLWQCKPTLKVERGASKDLNLDWDQYKCAAMNVKRGHPQAGELSGETGRQHTTYAVLVKSNRTSSMASFSGHWARNAPAAFPSCVIKWLQSDLTHYWFDFHLQKSNSILRTVSSCPLCLKMKSKRHCLTFLFELHKCASRRSAN